MGNVDEPVEIEWQFDALDLRPVERWLATLPTLALALDTDSQHTITAVAKPPRRMVDSYVDTEDWRMVRAGFVVRTRKRGRQDEVTLKDIQSAGAGGLRRRLEVTEDLPAGGVGALGPDGPVGRRVHAVAGRRPLSEVLQVRTRRRPFSLRVSGVEAAEIALDDTLVVMGNGQRPMQLRRVEVEVLAEWVEALEPLVQQLRVACGLQPASLSKFEAGLLALGAEIPGPSDLGSTLIERDTTTGDLAYAVLRRQLLVLEAKEPGTRLGEDPEELHDMRVATRRMRAALDLFANVLPVRAHTLHAELGWAAGVLGAVRDLDVQLEDLAVLPRSGGDDPWTGLITLLEGEREQARSDMLAALDSMRWERLLKALAVMVQQGPLQRSVAGRRPASMAMPDLIEARHSAVVKAARRAKTSGVAGDYHRLRIRCKRLRYSLEFGSDLYEDRTSRYTRQLASLQDKLGMMQDAEVAAARLQALATGEAHLPGGTIFVMGGVAEQHRRKFTRLLQQLPKQLSRVKGREWQDLVTTMEKRRLQAESLLPPGRQGLRSLPQPADTDEPANLAATEGSEPATPNLVSVESVVPEIPGTRIPPALGDAPG
jgi:triphosphatase